MFHHVSRGTLSNSFRSVPTYSSLSLVTSYTTPDRGICHDTLAGFEGVCGCDSYAGLTPLTRQGANGGLLPCVEAHCVYGPDACLERNYAGYISLTLTALAVVYLGVVFAYSLRILLRSCLDKSFSTNVTSTVLIWTIGGSFSNWAWHIADFVGFALPSAWAKIRFRNPVAVPLLTIFHVSREETCVCVVSVQRATPCTRICSFPSPSHGDSR